MRIAFAGDRDISVKVLKFIISKGVKPLALFVSSKEKATHANDLIQLSDLESTAIFSGVDFKSEKALDYLRALDLDYIIGIHFPYLVPNEVLSIPKKGFLNLHPAYLPYNKGWHTPSWAILDKTPIGGTLHYMGEEIDSGDIIHQKQIEISPSDSANSLYQKVKAIECDVFEEAWDKLIKDVVPSHKQSSEGSSHIKKDLFNDEIQLIELEKSYLAQDLIDKMRGLTTSDIKESAYFIKDGIKYRVTINIQKDE